jgi:hypothetical protein
MTESRAYINEIENEQTITMNPDILPTQKEWRLICKMVKQQRELTDEEIEHIAQQHLTVHVQFIGAGDCTIEGEIEFARAILQKASEK